MPSASHYDNVAPVQIRLFVTNDEHEREGIVVEHASNIIIYAATK